MISKYKYIIIKQKINELIKEGKTVTISIANELEIDYHSLLSIFSQMTVRVIKKNMRKIF